MLALLPEVYCDRNGVQGVVVGASVVAEEMVSGVCFAIENAFGRVKTATAFYRRDWLFLPCEGPRASPHLSLVKLAASRMEAILVKLELLRSPAFKYSRRVDTVLV